jgi:hypothetical protein
MVTGVAVGKVGDRLELVAAAGPDMLRIVPKALNAEVGLAETLVFVEVTLSTEGESSTSVGTQLTLVPGSVGSCASGGEARVIAGAPETVVAEKRLVNGPGPASGDDTTAPGVVGIALAVVPMVEVKLKQWAGKSNSLSRAELDCARRPGVDGARDPRMDPEFRILWHRRLLMQ